MTEKIETTPATRRFNRAVELADEATKYQYDRLSPFLLQMALIWEEPYHEALVEELRDSVKALEREQDDAT